MDQDNFINEIVNSGLKQYVLSAKIEEEMHWREWVDKIPYLKFPAHWEVKIIPPFACAIARFLVKKGDDRISIYLDCYDKLGRVGEPYWEVYPVNGDAERFFLSQTKELLECIDNELKRVEEFGAKK